MFDPPQRSPFLGLSRERLLAFGALAVLLVAGLVALTVWLVGRDDDDVPADAIAVVGDREISKESFDAVMTQAERSAELAKRDFPKAGTPEYNTIKNQVITYLVQREQFAQKAEDLDVEVTDKDVQARLDQIKQQYFGGDERRYRQQLKRSGITEEQVRADLRGQLVQERLFEKVTEDIKISDEEIERYYRENKSQYGTPASRDVRHILVPTRQQALTIRRQLEGGASFSALAKKFSRDPGSKDQGGRLTIARGQTEAAFDRAAFALRPGAISQPVRTRYGFHIIEAIGPIKPARTTPLKDVEAQIRQQLLQQKKQDAMTKWVEDTRKELDGDTTYQVGFAPPKPTGTTTAER